MGLPELRRLLGRFLLLSACLGFLVVWRQAPEPWAKGLRFKRIVYRWFVQRRSLGDGSRNALPTKRGFRSLAGSLPAFLGCWKSALKLSATQVSEILNHTSSTLAVALRNFRVPLKHPRGILHGPSSVMERDLEIWTPVVRAGSSCLAC